MKKFILGLFVLTSISAMSQEFRDGKYRGVFVSGQETQVEVQFNLENDKITSSKYRTLYYKGHNFLQEKDLQDKKDRFMALLDYAKGKKIKEVLEDFYTPTDIPNAGASVRSTKVRAAMQNALNSGVYKPAKKN